MISNTFSLAKDGDSEKPNLKASKLSKPQILHPRGAPTNTQPKIESFLTRPERETSPFYRPRADSKPNKFSSDLGIPSSPFHRKAASGPSNSFLQAAAPKVVSPSHRKSASLPDNSFSDAATLGSPRDYLENLSAELRQERASLEREKAELLERARELDEREEALSAREEALPSNEDPEGIATRRKLLRLLKDLPADDVASIWRYVTQGFIQHAQEYVIENSIAAKALSTFAHISISLNNCIEGVVPQRPSSPLSPYMADVNEKPFAFDSAIQVPRASTTYQLFNPSPPVPLPRGQNHINPIKTALQQHALQKKQWRSHDAEKPHEGPSPQSILRDIPINFDGGVKRKLFADSPNTSLSKPKPKPKTRSSAVTSNLADKPRIDGAAKNASSTPLQSPQKAGHVGELKKSSAAILIHRDGDEKAESDGSSRGSPMDEDPFY